jgi:hypothetical protein
VLFYAILAVFLLCISGVFYSQLHRYIHWDDWKAKTTPLPKETIDILCNNFELEKEHPVCNGKKDVYGPHLSISLETLFGPTKHTKYQAIKQRPMMR